MYSYSVVIIKYSECDDAEQINITVQTFMSYACTVYKCIYPHILSLASYLNFSTYEAYCVK